MKIFRLLLMICLLFINLGFVTAQDENILVRYEFDSNGWDATNGRFTDKSNNQNHGIWLGSAPPDFSRGYLYFDGNPENHLTITAAKPLQEMFVTGTIIVEIKPEETTNSLSAIVHLGLKTTHRDGTALELSFDSVTKRFFVHEFFGLGGNHYLMDNCPKTIAGGEFTKVQKQWIKFTDNTRLAAWFINDSIALKQYEVHAISRPDTKILALAERPYIIGGNIGSNWNNPYKGQLKSLELRKDYPDHPTIRGASALRENNEERIARSRSIGERNSNTETAK